jgi:hydrogenase-4 component F
VGQKDYKRLLAYSSVENMGVMATGVGLGGAATYGAMLHAVNHSFAKASLFFLAGNVLRTYGSSKASDVRGAAHRIPLSAGLLLAAFLAIGGSPPFGAFMSEFLVFRGALASNIWLAVLFAALLAIAFLGMAGVLLPMTQGKPPQEAPLAPEHVLSIVPPAVLVTGVLVLGLYVPPFLSRLLRDASALLGG